MDVVSYRGPGVAGGVSSGLGTAWRKESQASSRWWYMNKNVLEVLATSDARAKFISLVPEEIIEGHYGYCNEFLWPLMHDLPQYADYSAEQHAAYDKFNKIVAEQIDAEAIGRKEFFMQDYQLAISPRWLNSFGHRAVSFWHIPWPKNVPDEYVSQIRELAHGLLGASALGFHTEEYARNFMTFVRNHVGGYDVDEQELTITASKQAKLRRGHSHRRLAHKSFILGAANSPAFTNNSTKLLVHPLGIDVEFWTELKEASQSLTFAPPLQKILNKEFILSVDRVDYTKAVLDRLLIIDKFFEANPDKRGKLSFVQVCGRSRPGLPHFDQYWNSCRSLAAVVNTRWREDDWQPIEWVDQSMSFKELSHLYSKADAMLVNPVRDGLNLTAKEFIACQGRDPGALLLSPGAGAIHELGEHTLDASPKNHGATAQSIAQALNMPLKERQQRTLKMKTILVANQLSHWWTNFSGAATQPQMHVLEEEEQMAQRNSG